MRKHSTTAGPAFPALLVASLGSLLACDSIPEPTAVGTVPPTESPISAWEPRAIGDILFVSNRDGNDEIYSMTSTGTHQTNLSQSPAQDTDPSWSPDNKKVAFVRRTALASEIWIMSASGAAQTRLSYGLRGSPPYAHSPRWSPDGTRIAFLRSSGSGGGGSLYVIPAAGGSTQYLTGSGEVMRPAAWAPDGTRLALIAGKTSQFLYRINADGTGLMQLAPAQANDDDVYGAPNPCWAPGPRILYIGWDSDLANWEAFSIDPAGGASIQMTNGYAKFPFSACWSPDASRVLVSHDNEISADLFISDPAGSWFGGGWTRLTFNPPGVQSFARGFSPDGTRILSYRGPWGTDDFDIWTLKTDGTEALKLTGSGSNRDPDWRH
jgi:Tol biopolymer transport system component